MSPVILALLQVWLWILLGLSATVWLLPAGWRRFQWTLSVPLGVSLQMGSGWLLLAAGWNIEQAAYWVHALAFVPLAAALGWRRTRRRLVHTASASESWATLGVVFIAVILAISPLEAGPMRGLATLSLGSCDAPDYAFGARLFLEKGNHLHHGFWVQQEVHELGEMNLWSYWTRLNHFGPAACFAFTSALFRLPIWSVETVVSGVWAAAGAGLCVTIARSVFRLKLTPAVLIGLLYSVSPLPLYAVYHLAAGQLVGTLGMSGMVLLASAIPLARARSFGLGHVVVGAMMIWLLVGSYAFMILFALAAVSLLAAIHAAVRRAPTYLLRAVLWLGASGLVAALVFHERFIGLAFSIQVFGSGNSGWPLPPITLSTILGISRGIELAPLGPFLAIPIALAVSAGVLVGAVTRFRQRHVSVAVTISVLAIVFSARALLSHLDPGDANLGSYKIYKAVSVFLPVLLPALVGCLAHLGRMGSLLTTGVSGLLLLVASLYSFQPLWSAASRPPFRAGSELSALSAIERSPDVHGVNIIASHPWDRIWASAFLADKPQYFAEGSYITRTVVPLEGNWVLEDGAAGIYSSDTVHVGERLILRPVDKKPRLTLSFGEGWWPHEGTHRWGGASTNRMELLLTSASPFKVRVRLGGTFPAGLESLSASYGSETIQSRYSDGMMELGPLTVSPGTSVLRIEADAGLVKPKNPADTRTLQFMLRTIQLDELADEGRAEPGEGSQTP